MPRSPGVLCSTDARIDKTLALLGVFVFGVLGKIAMRARYGNFLGQINVQLMGRVVDFLQQLLFYLGQRVLHVCLFRSDHIPCSD